MFYFFYWVVLCHPILMVSEWPSLKIITFDDESVKKVIFFLHFTFQQCIKLYLWQFFFLIFELILTIVCTILIVTWWIVWWYQIRHKHYIVKQSMKKTKSLIAILQKRFFFLKGSRVNWAYLSARRSLQKHGDFICLANCTFK